MVETRGTIIPKRRLTIVSDGWQTESECAAGRVPLWNETFESHDGLRWAVVRIDVSNREGQVMSTSLGSILRGAWSRVRRGGTSAGSVRQLSFDLLEPRVLLSAQGTDLLASLVGAPPPNDAFEENDSFGAATNLGIITTTKGATSLTVNDDDWYRFRILRTGESGDYVKINFKHSQGDVDLALHDDTGAFLTKSNSQSNFEQISLEGKAAGQYFIRVYGFGGVTNPNYSLYVDAPYNPDDASENNDTRAAARNLGKLTTPLQLADRVLLDDDWYKFTTTRTGTEASFVQIGFKHAQGDVDMRLYNGAGIEQRSSTGSANFEFISLNGLPVDTYYVQVYGPGGAVNGSYDLSIAAPNAKNGEHTLYLNFDGASLSRANLDDWANNGGNGLSPGDWYYGLSDPTNGLDDDNDGIDVSPFLETTSSRETIIGRMLSYINSDLAPFGMQAVRHFGIAVADQQATTLFLGAATLTNGNRHVACDIDVGNINSTDIAFCGDANSGLELWKTVGSVALLNADNVIHEAGHTFGLKHVNSGDERETMGLRYNTPQNDWDVNTSYKNKWFNLLDGSGAIQNSYNYMQNTFVTGGPVAPAVHLLGSVHWGALANPAPAGAAELLSVSNVQSYAPSLAGISPWSDFTADPLAPSWSAASKAPTRASALHASSPG